MNEVKLNEKCIKDIMLAINIQLLENGIISEDICKKAQDKLKKTE